MVKKCGELRPDVSRLALDEFVILRDAIETSGKKENELSLPAQELINIFKSADLFVFPSLTETFGVAIVEAMANGLPVLTTDSSGFGDAFGYGAWGLTSNPLDYEGFSETIIEFMDSNHLRRKFQTKSKERAKCYDWELVVSK